MTPCARGSPLASGRLKRMAPRRLPASAPSPASSSSSSSSSPSPAGRAAWSLTLPVQTSEFCESRPAHDAIAIEFHVPRRSSFLAASNGVLPDVSRSPSGHRRSSIVHSLPQATAVGKEGGGRVLPLVDESAAVTVDEIAMLGIELHTSLALAPGVTQQTVNGVVLQSGPELPVEKTRMRRATFLVSVVLMTRMYPH
ncbi:hypothetical protein PINS_up009747 [Pythium insidiosum]|nr:hypothetical protein PINS_up009747 [Pythium insidiosum]